MEKRRLRVIPPKYVMIGTAEMTPAASEAFMKLYKQFGKPYDSMYVFRYLIKHRDIVADIYSDGDNLKVDIYASPKLQRIVIRKRVKMVNIIAREVNSKGIAYCGPMMDSLYYIVRRRNDVLYERALTEYNGNEEVLRREWETKVDEGIKKRIHAEDIDYVPEVFDMVNEIFE